MGIALPNAALNVGLQYTTASVSSIIQASGPVLTVIFAIILLKERLGGAKVVGTLLALVGTVLLISWDGMDLADSTFIGNLFVLASAFSYSVSGVVSKKALARHHPMAITGWSLVIGSLALYLATPLEFGRPMSFPPDLIGIVLLLAIFPGCLAFLLYYYILQTKDLSSISFFIYLIPVFSTAISIALLGEIVTAETVLFASFVIAGVAIAQYAPARKRRVNDEGRGTRTA